MLVVFKDEPKAAEWYQEAAGQGHASAQKKRGDFYAGSNPVFVQSERKTV